MYEAIEHWKQYKQEKQAKQELDNFINKLVVNNGVTNI